MCSLMSCFAFRNSLFFCMLGLECPFRSCFCRFFRASLAVCFLRTRLPEPMVTWPTPSEASLSSSSLSPSASPSGLSAAVASGSAAPSTATPSRGTASPSPRASSGSTFCPSTSNCSKPSLDCAFAAPSAASPSSGPSESPPSTSLSLSLASISSGCAYLPCSWTAVSMSSSPFRMPSTVGRICFSASPSSVARPHSARTSSKIGHCSTCMSKRFRKKSRTPCTSRSKNSPALG
mmetsp:Transcript_49494/g.127730  ORF Transcript_49494/g.127730 Transcript_49494/m.127730 type:complete len:234 (-) Transcript_49494:564-1265(-)